MVTALVEELARRVVAKGSVVETGQPEDADTHDLAAAEQSTESEDTSTPVYGHDERFKDAAAGRTELNKGFDLWTRLLADRSLHASYAVIAAAWAIFGTADQLLGNFWAMLAVLTAVSYVGLALCINFLVVILFWLQQKYAREDPERWSREWADSKSPESNWPWTAGLERVPMPYNLLKIVLPLLAVIFLAVAIISYFGDTEEIVSPTQTAIRWR